MFCYGWINDHSFLCISESCPLVVGIWITPICGRPAGSGPNWKLFFYVRLAKRTVWMSFGRSRKAEGIFLLKSFCCQIDRPTDAETPGSCPCSPHVTPCSLSLTLAKPLTVTSPSSPDRHWLGPGEAIATQTSPWLLSIPFSGRACLSTGDWLISVALSDPWACLSSAHLPQPHTAWSLIPGIPYHMLLLRLVHLIPGVEFCPDCALHLHIVQTTLIVLCCCSIIFTL